MTEAISWAAYQSMIQLGAGLNLGYLGLSSILPTNYRLIKQAREKIIEDVKEKKTSAPDAVKFSTLIITVERVESFEKWMLGLNPIMCSISGIGCIGLLVVISNYPDGARMQSWHALVVPILSYGWLAALFLFVLISSYVLHRVKKRLQRLVEES